MKEICSYEDVELLVKSFYKKVEKNDLMIPHFANVDWEKHFPKMIDFWAFILIDKEGYKGNVFDKHVHLKIDERHFTIWVNTFCETVDELFVGEKAELAKQRAKVLGYTFQTKMKEIRKE
jgi:hemoglobin